MIAKRLFIICAVAYFACLAFPQERLSRNSGRDIENTDKAEPDTVRPGSAWTLTFPLGNHVESTIDTLTYNFQRRSIPSMVSDAYATT